MSQLSCLPRQVWPVASLLLLALPLAAQCGLPWQPGAPAPGPNRSVNAVLPLPNGDVIAGGEFTVADASVAHRVARWDGSTWRALAGGIDDGRVYALARLSNGDLVAGGQFESADGLPARHIARWNGSAWSGLGAIGGAPGFVTALAVLANGDLIAAGAFDAAGGQPADNIARWNGATWTSLGTGLPLSAIYALQQLANGDLIAGGTITQAGGQPTQGLARFDGANWTPFVIPGLAANSTVNRLALLPNGDLAIAGQLTVGANAEQLGVWNGSTLQVLVPPVGSLRALAAAPTGHLLVGGYTISHTATVARFDGASWTDLSAGAPAFVIALAIDNAGTIFAGGIPFGVVPTQSNAVARYDGVQWTSMGVASAPRALALQRLPGGDVVVGGAFQELGGVSANNLARWNGANYAPLGLGVNGTVTALALANNGDLLVGGSFTTAGGTPAAAVARWNGAAWATLGAGLPAAATSLAANAAGEILAVGGGLGSQLARFDGLAWSPLNTGYSGLIEGMIAMPDGDIALSGLFSGPAGLTGALRYAGGAFTPLASGPFTFIRGLAVSPDGDVIALGAFTTLGTGLARLSGATWVPFGGPLSAAVQLRDVAFLPNGELIATGPFTQFEGQPANGTLRFDGANWNRMDGLDGGAVSSLAVSSTGTLFAAGSIYSAGGVASVGLARAEPNCPATAAPFGAGCTGGAGPVSLAADSLPWAGSAFRSTAYGMAAISLALHVLGTQPIVQPLPMGAPGCSLLTAPLDLVLLVPSGGEVHATLLLPANPSLAGTIVRTQIVALELDATAAILRVTSSNALDLTIGAL